MKLNKCEFILANIVTEHLPETLNLKFMKYPAIHTNYIISDSTTLPYNHNISHGT